MRYLQHAVLFIWMQVDVLEALRYLSPNMREVLEKFDFDNTMYATIFLILDQ